MSLHVLWNVQPYTLNPFRNILLKFVELKFKSLITGVYSSRASVVNVQHLYKIKLRGLPMKNITSSLANTELVFIDLLYPQSEICFHNPTYRRPDVEALNACDLRIILKLIVLLLPSFSSYKSDTCHSTFHEPSSRTHKSHSVIFSWSSSSWSVQQIGTSDKVR